MMWTAPVNIRFDVFIFSKLSWMCEPFQSLMGAVEIFWKWFCYLRKLKEFKFKFQVINPLTLGVYISAARIKGMTKFILL